MPFKIASVVLSLYALIGAFICLTFTFDRGVSLVMVSFLFVIMPSFGAYLTWHKKTLGIFSCALLFAFLSVRPVTTDNILPHIAPITLSFPLGDFTQGGGMLIDFFAIFMACFLAWLGKVSMASNAV